MLSSFLTMIQTKTRASRFSGRLFKSAATSALVLSAVAGGGVILSGADAKAGTSVTYKDLGINFEDVISDITNRCAQIATVNLELTTLKWPNPQKQVDINHATNGSPLTFDDVVSYRINKTGVDHRTGQSVQVWFDEVSLNINAIQAVGQPKPTVYKEVFAVDPSTPGATPIADLLADSDTGNIKKLLPNKYSHLWIRDTFKPNGGTIDNAINDFRDVPGPLPILGAGAAFGFSRKLRSRIKASRTA
ncbi:MAG: hypothetical protein ACKOYK_04255 [Cyanobium sp.]